MAKYKHISIPTSGKKIEFTAKGVPKKNDHPIVPFIEGDGIGPDIWSSAKRILDSSVEAAYNGKKKIEWMEIFAGEKALSVYGKDEWLPAETLKALKEFKVGIKGPLTTPVGGGIRSINVALRQTLDLYACVRPVRWFPGVAAPVKHPGELDVVIFRENTEDVYAGIEYKAGSKDAKELIKFISETTGKKVRPASAIGIKPVSALGSKRLVKRAIQYAIDNDRPTVTLVHKGNIMKFTEGGFRNWGYDVAKKEFGNKVVTWEEVQTKYKGKQPKGKILINDVIADAMFQNLLLDPAQYDVIATLNLNGDYLSDACAAQVGGLGLAPGANFGDKTVIFEATHGTAPAIAGKDLANPSSVLLSAVMMLEFFGWKDAADLVYDALSECIRTKRVTKDLADQMTGAESLTCSAFGKAMVDTIAELAAQRKFQKKNVTKKSDKINVIDQFENTANIEANQMESGRGERLYQSNLDDYLKNAQGSVLAPFDGEDKDVVKYQNNTLYKIKEDTLDSGLRSVPVGHCVTSFVDPIDGVHYAGYAIADLAYKEPEEVIYLLFNLELPNKQQLIDFKEELRDRAKVHPLVIERVARLPKDAHPMQWLTSGINAMAMFNTGNYRNDCMNFVAQIPEIVAAIFRVRNGWGEPLPSKPELGYMENFTYMMGAPGAHANLEKLMKIFNILHFDHGGGNLSTLVGKAVASGHEHVYGSLIAAMCALDGPLHGRANQECLAFIDMVLEKVPNPEDELALEKFIENHFENGGKIFGFGHAVLRGEDPRATVQYALGEDLGLDTPHFKMAKALRKVAVKVLSRNPKVSNPYPNVDAVSGSLLKACGLEDENYYTVLFGLSRCVGIAAQILYERTVARGGKGVPIMRPKYIYAGPRRDK
jgi:isocitrate dehydrogenase